MTAISPTKPVGRVPRDVLAVVAVGGALGAAARYGLTMLWPSSPVGFPWATLLINLLGCALLGALMGATNGRIQPYRLVTPFLGTGILGGFTTFSAYAVEIRGLLAAGRPSLALGYLAGTLAGALAAVWLGEWSASRVRPGPGPGGPRR